MNKTCAVLLSVMLSAISFSYGQDSIFSPDEMKEDFLYMMNQYERIHPEPYRLMGEKRYKRMKKNTLRHIRKPMSHLDFWMIIGEWNQYFDGHTEIGLPTVPASKEWRTGQIAFPPHSVIQYRNRKLFFSGYDGIPDSIKNCEILEINGHSSKEIIRRILPYVSHESEATINIKVLRNLGWFYKCMYGYEDHLILKYLSIDGCKMICLNRDEIKGWIRLVEKNKSRRSPWNFKIYPEQGIALIEINQCGPVEKLEEFDSLINVYVDSVNRCGIGHLFVDVSHNFGGDSRFASRFFSHIAAAPDTMLVTTFKKTHAGRISDAKWKNGRFVKWTGKAVYSGILYVIQSQCTYSAANYFVNLPNYYKFGITIGEETGGLSTTYTNRITIPLPNSGLYFYCSDMVQKDVGSKGFQGIKPDVPYDIEYKYLFRSFSEKELQKFLILEQ